MLYGHNYYTFLKSIQYHLLTGFNTNPRSFTSSLSLSLEDCHRRMVMLARQDDSANPFQNSLWMSTNPDQPTLYKMGQKTRGTFANIPTDFLTWSADTASTNPVSSIGVATRLWTGRIPAGARGFCRLIIVQNGSGAHPASSSMGTGVLSRGQSGRGFHLVPSWSLSLLPPYALMTWTETTLLFSACFRMQKCVQNVGPVLKCDTKC